MPAKQSSQGAVQSGNVEVRETTGATPDRYQQLLDQLHGRIAAIGSWLWQIFHCDAAERKFMLSNIRFINAMPLLALTSREVNLVSKGDEASDACTINSPYLIAVK